MVLTTTIVVYSMTNYTNNYNLSSFIECYTILFTCILPVHLNDIIGIFSPWAPVVYGHKTRKTGFTFYKIIPNSK